MIDRGDALVEIVAQAGGDRDVARKRYAEFVRGLGQRVELGRPQAGMNLDEIVAGPVLLRDEPARMFHAVHGLPAQRRARRD